MQFDPSVDSALINYYYTNYTDCRKDTSYLASWQFVATFLHSVLIFQSPLAIFTGYCIIQKTPKVMGSLKWAMLNVHLWSCYMDILICSMVTPFLMLPAIGGFTVGVFRFLGVPTAFQAYLAIISVGFMFNSISALFENRSSSFEINRFRFKSTLSRMTFFILNGLITATLLIPILEKIPDQNTARIKQLLTLPCPHPEYFSSNVFIFINDSGWLYYFAGVLTVQWCWIFFSIIFFISCTTYHIFYASSATYSIQTKKLQKMFFIGNVVQVAIPSVFWAIPGFSLVYIVGVSYYSQSMNNVGVAFVSLHGLASMLTTLSIHKPYRSYIQGLFIRRTPLILPSPPLSTDN